MHILFYQSKRNVRTLLEPGAAHLLIDELEAAHIAIMGLQEVRWSDSGEIGVGNYHLLWSGPAEGQPRQGGEWGTFKEFQRL